MTERPARRRLLRITALATAALLAFGGTPSVLAQEDPVSTAPPPTETVAPPPQTESPAPPSSTEPSTPPNPAPPSDTQPPPVAPPAPTSGPAKPDEGAPDLKLAVTFDHSENTRGKPLALTVTVRNTGDATANQVRFTTETRGMNLTTGVDGLVSHPVLAPGESKTFKLGGAADQGAENAGLTMRTYVEGATDKTPDDNVAQAETTLVDDTGTITGVIFEDRNGNGAVDPGEGLVYQRFRLTGPPGYSLTTATGEDGRFTIPYVYMGTYQVRYFGHGPDGGPLTVKPGQLIVVRGGETTDVELEAVPSLSATLSVAGHSFDKAKYAKGDPISVSVTLRNSGTTPITGLVAVCDEENDPATLDGTGDGWGDLRPGRPGVTVGAGETKTFTVTDTVPDVDYPNGKVYFACSFSLDASDSTPEHNAGNPGLTTGADVAGIFGSASGRLLHAGSGPVNEPTKIVAFNPAANRIVGETTTSDSNWKIENLPHGKIELLVVGRLKLADGSARRVVDVVADQDVSVDLVVVDGPEVKDPTVYAPDLQVSVTFDRQAYDINDPVVVTIKIENVGTGTRPSDAGTASGGVDQPLFEGEDAERFADLRNSPVVVWPGESKQVTVTGVAPHYDAVPQNNTMRFWFQVGEGADPNPDNNSAEAQATVTWQTGSAVVTVYGDLNLNRQLDAGEELANHEVFINGGRPWRGKTARSDAQGKVRFTDLPTGSYLAGDRYDPETGWIPPGLGPEPEQQMVVTPGGEGSALVRLVRPLSDKLKVTMKFDQASYPPGSDVGLSISITNNFAAPMLVKAFCTGSYDAFLGNERPEWGQLRAGGPGVEVAAGARFDFHVTTAMPAASPDHGYVAINCMFGPENRFGGPQVYAKTKVPGATHTFWGQVVTTVNQNLRPVPHVKLVLLDPDTGKPVVSTIADASGGWTFPDLAVGPYTPVVVGPWRLVFAGDVENVRGQDGPLAILVEPGPYIADPTAAGPGPGGGSPGENTDALATTGVSVLGLGLFGLLLVMAGAAMRRKPARS